MKWIVRWGYEMAEKPTRPGIYRLKAGGFFVRARVTDLKRKRHEVTAVLSDAKTPAEAQRSLDDLVADARAEVRGESRSKQSWLAFADARLEERIRKGKMQSEATVDRWKEALAVFGPEWGAMNVLAVTSEHIDAWLNTTVAEWMTTGRTTMRPRRGDGESRRTRGPLEMRPVTTVLKPSYVNGWLRVLRAICHAVKVKFKLATSAFDGIDFFEEGRIHTREKPNALTRERLGEFMAIARSKFPQHFAMILLGFVTGLRPSSLRPLRRKGPEADIDWTTGLLIVRRSHSRKQRIMNKTKTGKDTEITLPPSVLEVLREHAMMLPNDSDLLFPGTSGRLLTRGVLAKPFAAITAEMGLPYPLTPKGMRRTFNDICRAIGIHDVVTRSISGHQTSAMQVHYSTAGDAEQAAAVDAVVKVAEGRSQ